MKLYKAIPFLLMISASHMLLAEGAHDGGHNESMKSMHGDAHWMAPMDEAEIQNPIPASLESIQTGEKLFKANCVSCHGDKADGKGVGATMFRPAPADLLAMSGNHPDGDFAYKIREGRRAMPAWKNFFNDTQIWHLVNYIQSLSTAAAGSMPGNKAQMDHSEHMHAH